MDFNIEKYHLKSLSLLSFFENQEQEIIRKKSARKEFNKGEYIFRENTLPKGVYVVRKGKIKIFQTSTDGRQSIVYFYRKGDFFGHRPVLAGEDHPVSAVALDNVVVTFITKDTFISMLEKSESLTRSLLVNLSREFSVWINKTTVFAQFSVKKRVALSLLILKQVYAKSTPKKSKTNIRINRDDFASYVGTAKETLVRTLRYFKDEGIISANRTSINILKVRALINMVDVM